MDIFNISQILFWIAVGTFLAIGVLLFLNWYRNLYGKPPEIIDSEDNPLNRQTKMIKDEMRKQEADRQNRAEEVKSALGAEAEKVSSALSVEAERVNAALGVQAEKVSAALGVQVEKVHVALDAQATKVHEELEKQNSGTKESFTIQPVSYTHLTLPTKRIV